MSILAKSGGKQIDPVPTGMHVARCISMIHIGTIEETFLNETKEGNKVLLTWELPGVLHDFGDGEEARKISKEYTLSMNEKANLRKDLDSWRGTAFTEEEALEFDVTKLLGVDCMIQVIHKETAKKTIYAKVNVITPLAVGMKAPKQIYESFEFNYKNIKENFDSVPEWIQKKIVTSKEFLASGFEPEVKTESPKAEKKTAPTKKKETVKEDEAPAPKF